MPRQIDLNCDLGESFGIYALGNDEQVLPFITSANVACGFHAGDPQVMAHTVRCCAEHGVAVGAHVSYPDLNGFGRREMDLSPAELQASVLYQMGALLGFCRAAGVPLCHVKPHGALYNAAARQRDIAEPVVQAVYRFDPQLVLFAPPGSQLAAAGAAAGLPVAAEGFADRAYNDDGSLVDRRLPGAVHHELDAVVRQAVRLVTVREVVTITGGTLPLPVGTICVHGDTPGALTMARQIHSALVAAGAEVRPCRV